MENHPGRREAGGCCEQTQQRAVVSHLTVRLGIQRSEPSKSGDIALMHTVVFCSQHPPASKKTEEGKKKCVLLLQKSSVTLFPSKSRYYYNYKQVKLLEFMSIITRIF